MSTAEQRQKPTKERLRQAKGEHERVVMEHVYPDGRKETATTERMLDGSVLDRLASRGSITGDQYNAGAVFYADWYASGLAASGVVDLEKPIVDNSPKPDPTSRMDAQTRYAKAVKAIGIVHSLPLTCMILSEESLEAYGRRRLGYKNPKDCRTAAVTALRISLDALDMYYHGDRRHRYGASHVSGYRPEIKPGY